MSIDLPPELTIALDCLRPHVGRPGSTILYYPPIGSTNDVAAAHAREGLVVVGDEQTAGRGRRGRASFSPPGSGLYMSIVVAPSRARESIETDSRNETRVGAARQRRSCRCG
jgi:Biotin/lipoate A/B protein ligase family